MAILSRAADAAIAAVVQSREARAGEDGIALPFAPGNRVLVVDDEAAVVRVLARFLELAGYEAAPASNLAEAGEAVHHIADRGCIFAALLDWRLEGGVRVEEFVPLLRTVPIPFAIVTGYPADPGVAKLAAEGVPVLPKPPLEKDFGEVIEWVKSVDEQRRRLVEIP